MYPFMFLLTLVLVIMFSVVWVTERLLFLDQIAATLSVSMEEVKRI